MKYYYNQSWSWSTFCFVNLLAHLEKGEISLNEQNYYWCYLSAYPVVVSSWNFFWSTSIIVFVSIYHLGYLWCLICCVQHIFLLVFSHLWVCSYNLCICVWLVVYWYRYQLLSLDYFSGLGWRQISNSWGSFQNVLKRSHGLILVSLEFWTCSQNILSK